VAVLTAVGWWMTRESYPGSAYVSLVRSPEGIMGTATTLVAVVPRGHESTAQRALENAERALRRVDALMSTYLEDSEISILNRSPAGEVVVLSPAVRDVLASARRVWRESDGAFDPTCRPVLELWRRAGAEGRIPSPQQMATARGASSWDDFAAGDEGYVRKRDSARIDLGGIAKGYGIDRAFEALMAEGCEGALVDVGGDLRVGGHDDRGRPWRIEVRHPFGAGVFAAITLSEGSVCTSGGYSRFVEIDGVRYSHIVDPRSGMPATAAASVTVVAGDAITADAWATALSVLGREGIELLPGGIEAMLVGGTDEACAVHASPGMSEILEGVPDPPCQG